MRNIDSWIETKGIPNLNPPSPLQTSTPSLIAHWIGLTGLRTRSDVSRATGLGRGQVSNAWQFLQSVGLLTPSGQEKRGTRGQPSLRGELSLRAGLVLGIDCGTSTARLALSTLNRVVVLRRQFTVTLAGGPDHFLDSLSKAIDSELNTAISKYGPLRHITIGIPARIDYAKGAPVRPTIMPGWDGIPVGRVLEEKYGADVSVENEVNLRAFAESLNQTVPGFPIVAVKVGWGIGAGIATGPGQLLHGFSGAAGELGHTPVAGKTSTVRCRCGKTNCLEARACLGAIIAGLEHSSPTMEVNLDAQDRLLHRLIHSDLEAHDAVHQAGLILGENLANVCDLLNPRVISLTSVLNSSSEGLLAGVRANVHAQSRPLASRDVSVRLASYGDDTGLIGALAMSISASIQSICESS